MRGRMAMILTAALAADCVNVAYHIGDKPQTVDAQISKLLRGRYDRVPESEQDRRMTAAQAKRDRRNGKRLREAGK